MTTAGPLPLLVKDLSRHPFHTRSFFRVTFLQCRPEQVMLRYAQVPSPCICRMRELWLSSNCSVRLVTEMSSRILATLPLLRHSGGPLHAILTLITRYGFPQGSCPRVAQNSLHFSSLLRSIALFNLFVASLNSFTRPVLSLPAATSR